VGRTSIEDVPATEGEKPMSVEQETRMFCDGCGIKYDGVACVNRLAPSTIRAVAKIDGWVVNASGDDWCPQCSDRAADALADAFREAGVDLP
jgi:hypothetical protein